MLSKWNDDSYWFDFGPQSREFDRALRTLDELRRGIFRGFDESHPAQWSPRVHLRDTGQEFVVQAEVPGLGERDLDISLNATTLTLRAERVADVPEGYTVHRKERGNLRFERSWQLPSKVDPEKAEATLKNGVLELKLPKAAEAQPKQIHVKAA